MNSPDTAAVIDLAFYASAVLAVLTALLVLSVGAALWGFASYVRALGDDGWGERDEASVRPDGEGRP